MNRTAEAIINGQIVTTKEAFELVNAYDFSTLNILDNGNITMCLNINKFETYRDIYEFSQSCMAGSNKYILHKDDVTNVTAKYQESIDAIFIECQLPDGKRLHMTIFHVSDGEKDISGNDYAETDLDDIREFLDASLDDSSEWYCILATITDIFGFDMKMRNPIRVFINDLNWDKLHISDDVNTFEVPVMDDSTNEFYIKESENSKEIIIKPYNQPFMDIKLLFFKRHEQK